jgi:hypothetical protein
MPRRLMLLDESLRLILHSKLKTKCVPRILNLDPLDSGHVNTADAANPASTPQPA